MPVFSSTRPLTPAQARLQTATLPAVSMARRPASQPLQASPIATSQWDAVLLGTIVTMAIFGLIMVQSASQLIDPADPTYFFRRQVLWLTCGAVALFVTATIDYHVWRWFANPVMVAAFVLLVLVLRLGVQAGGAQRWLGIGSLLTFQPSEVAKLALVLFLAHRLATTEPLSRRHLLITGGTLLAAVGIVLIQNDMGTAVVLASCGLALLVSGRFPLRYLVPGSLGATGIGMLLIACTPFRRGRLTAFLHPLDCHSAVSYHVCQSLLAIGSGGIWGDGLGHGLQKAGYLPAPFTDSIYAVIGEELGLWGTMLVLLLFGLLLWRGMQISLRATDAFGALVALGITTWLCMQAVLNIGSNVAAIPFTGVPLPLISFGGSSLVISLAAIGILVNIARQTPVPTLQGRALGRISR